MHCVSHRLELGALDAMKECDAKVFADLKSVLLNLHKHYHYSEKAFKELQILAEMDTSLEQMPRCPPKEIFCTNFSF